MRERLARWNREAARQVLHALVALALVLLAAPAAQAGIWQCEGRACGVTPWVCCCASPSDSHGADCDGSSHGLEEHRHPASHGPQAAGCARACDCVMVAPPGHFALASTAATSAPPLDAVALPLAAPSSGAPVTFEVARFYASRGPPPAAPVPSFPSPRGPPLR